MENFDEHDYSWPFNYHLALHPGKLNHFQELDGDIDFEVDDDFSSAGYPRGSEEASGDSAAA